jgi:integrase
MTTETAETKLRLIEGRKHLQPPALRYWIDDFITTKRWRWRPPTLKAYTSVLGLYAAHVGEDHWPPDRREVLRWLAQVKERCSDATVHPYWVHLRTFFNYLERVEALTPSQNPARQIVDLNAAPDEPDLPPAAFPPEDLERLFGYLGPLARAGDRAAIRDLALLRFAYVTGCREGEIARLTLERLDLRGYEATVLYETSKGKKLRTVYFDEDVRRDLRDWLDVRPAVPGVREVFASLGNRWTSRQRETPCIGFARCRGLCYTYHRKPIEFLPLKATGLSTGR